MSIENVVVFWEGTNITTEVINFTRTIDICTGIGTLDLTVKGTSTRNFGMWDEILLEEGDEEVGIFNIAHVEKIAPDGVISISSQDNSKRLQDYFIDVELPVEYMSYTKDWMITVLELAGVNYNFTTGDDGELVALGSNFGMQSAYNSMMSLLQLTGWYMFFNANGTCVIGPLSVPASATKTFTDRSILSISSTKDDKMLRNKATVWGMGGISATVTASTPWDRDDGQDYRTVVYANPSIATNEIATEMAEKLIDEFSSTTPVKIITVAGLYPEITVGDRVTAVSNFISFSGMVSTLVSDVGEDGATMTLTVDKKCPRLFGYAVFEGEPNNYEIVYSLHPNNNNSIVGYYSPKVFTPPYAVASGIDIMFTNSRRMFGVASRDGYLYWSFSQNSATYQAGLYRLAVASGIMPPSGLIFPDIDVEEYTEYLAYGTYILLNNARVLTSTFYWPSDGVDPDDYTTRFKIQDFDNPETDFIVAELPTYNSSWADIYYYHYTVVGSNLLVIFSWEYDYDDEDVPFIFSIYIYNINTGSEVYKYQTDSLYIDGLYQYPTCPPIVVNSKVYFTACFNNFRTLAETEADQGAGWNDTAIIIEVDTAAYSCRILRPRYNDTVEHGIALILQGAYDSGLEKLVFNVVTYSEEETAIIYTTFMFVDLNTLEETFSEYYSINTSEVCIGILVDSFNLAYIVIYNNTTYTLTLYYAGNIDASPLFSTGLNISNYFYEDFAQPPKICNIIDEDGRFWYSHNGNLYGIYILDTGDMITIEGGIPEPYNYSYEYQVVYLVGGVLYAYNNSIYDSKYTLYRVGTEE